MIVNHTSFKGANYALKILLHPLALTPPLTCIRAKAAAASSSAG